MANPHDQLIKCLGLLSSNHDGEVLAAARKVQALMIGMDATWPQLLANGGGADLTKEQIAKVYAVGLQRGEALGYQRGMADAQVTAPQVKGPTIEVADDLEWITKILAAAEQAQPAGHLDSFEVDFSESMRARVSRFGRAAYLSQKQLDAMRRLEQSLRRRGYL